MVFNVLPSSSSLSSLVNPLGIVLEKRETNTLLLESSRHSFVAQSSIVCRNERKRFKNNIRKSLHCAARQKTKIEHVNCTVQFLNVKTKHKHT